MVAASFQPNESFERAPFVRTRTLRANVFDVIVLIILFTNIPILRPRSITIRLFDYTRHEVRHDECNQKVELLSNGDE